MKDYILEEKDEENNNEKLIISVKEERIESNKKCNYKFWIIILSILDMISLIMLFILVFALDTDWYWLFVSLVIITSIILSIFIILKLKDDKNQEQLRISRLEEELKRQEEEEKRRQEEEIIRRQKEEEEEKKRIEEENIRRKKEEEEKKRLEEEQRLNEIKKQMLENQKKLREVKENSEQMTEQQINQKINNVLEDMCAYGSITKKEIQEEKAKHTEKFIETTEALKMENQDTGMFALGLLSQNLEELGIETAIEKDENPNKQDEDSVSLQFITNGMASKKKYDLHFELGEERNEELLNNKEEYEKFKENLKLKLSKDYNIPPEKIVITFPERGSFHVQLIFQSDEFNNLNQAQFINKFKNDPEFKELSNLKSIHEDVIMGGVKLSRNVLDPRGNRNDGWGVGEKRGGKIYDPPIGWNGIGLKVFDKYDHGDNTWIGMNNAPGEWYVAYHGVCVGQNSEQVKKITGTICKTEFQAGKRQAHEYCDDQYHPGKKVGSGVYCTPTIKTAEGYAGISNINGCRYKTVLMVRVKPNVIRHCDKCSSSKAPYNYWVVNGTTDEIRPYRILYKKV